MTTFFRLFDNVEKETSLHELCSGRLRERRFEVDPADFRAVPNSPFAYWVSATLRQVFDAGGLEASGDRIVRQGLGTHDDFRWLRLAWEPSSSSGMSPLAKGGTFAKYYSDLYLLVDWRESGRVLSASKLERLRRGEITENNSKCWSRQHYGRAGLTWPRRANGLSFRAVPAGSVFGDKGPCIFVEGDSKQELLALLAIVNSSTFESLMKLQVARTTLAQSYEVGLVRTTPVPASIGGPRLASLALHGWSARRSLDTVNEVSHAFVVPAVLQVGGESFGERATVWAAQIAEVEAELELVQSEIDDLCFEMYGISDEDRVAIGEGFGVSEGDGGDDGGDEDGDELVAADPSGLAAGLVSWAIGVGVGRFDVRLATGERGWPAEPDPFDPLPVCSPAMLTGDDGLPLPLPLPGYSVEVSPMLVDDPGHRLDITSRVRAVFDLVFGADADDWWGDAGEALGARPGEISSWLSKGFFDHHLKTHSKSRRRAPILWPIGTASGSYAVWLYAHRVTADSLFQVLNDLVDPKLSVEQRRLVELTQDAGPNPGASQRRVIDAQERLVGELRELRSDLEAVAPLWAPDLNDGIVIVLAPLWRLFAHQRSWSRELKKHWDKLAAGDYDWSQLAMHLWPERVVPKCAEDRSLAIAHQLEDVFWVQDDNDDKWHPRMHPTTPLGQLIADRHNPAVTTALQRANS
jgi:hypothetical protein